MESSGRGRDASRIGWAQGRPSSSSNTSQHTHRNNNSNSDTIDAPPNMDPTMKVVSVFEERSRMAFACYDEEKNEILIEQSPVLSSQGYDTEQIVQGFLSLSRPNLILLGSKIVSNTPLFHLLTKMPPLGDISMVNDRSNEESSEHNGSRNVGSSSSRNTNTSFESGGTRNMNETTPLQQQQTTIPYRMLKTGAFDVRACKATILSKLRVLTLLKHQHQHQHQSTSASISPYHALASIIDFESTVLIRALGSLLSFLQSTIFRLEEGATVTVNTIQLAHSSSFVRIDSATLHSLHIFSTEHHPLLAGNKGNRGNAKEGFSLFTLLDRTKSKIGRQCLKEWMLQPLLDPVILNQRYDGIDLFLHPECCNGGVSNGTNVGVLLNLMSRVGAVDKILLRMQKCVASPQDFLVLLRTLSAAVTLCATLGGDIRDKALKIDNDADEEERMMSEDRETTADAQDEQGGNCDGSTFGERGRSGYSTASTRTKRCVAFLDDILERCFPPTLRNLYERVVSIIDEDMTTEMKDSVVIQYGFNEELDSAKEVFDTLDETLSAVGSQILNKHPDLRQVKVVFLPQVGFLISIDKRQHSHDVTTNEFPELPQDFTFVFLQDNDAFFKNPDMRNLDDEIGDLDAFIKDTESMIVSELEEEILECESELRSTFGALAELDCILSFASCAADLNFVRPEVVSGNDGSNEENFIFIENGRHPLQELIIDDEFIANDTMIDNTNRVNVITGPNFSGKSCYTRQVGVLVYLAHIGCFLPCDRAKISITDQILARISSVETCAVPQSSFQLDLTQMASIMRRSTSRTLVLIDEFGKGKYYIQEY